MKVYPPFCGFEGFDEVGAKPLGRNAGFHPVEVPTRTAPTPGLYFMLPEVAELLYVSST